MLLETYVMAVYATLLIVGGAMGYVKAKSKPSLIAGIVSGLLALTVVGLNLSGRPVPFFGAGLAAAMTIVFAIRLRKTGKFMPAGLMLVLSVLVLILLLAGRYLG